MIVLEVFYYQKKIEDERKSFTILSQINEGSLLNEQEEKIKKEIDESAKASKSLTFNDIISEMFNPELKKQLYL